MADAAQRDAGSDAQRETGPRAGERRGAITVRALAWGVVITLLVAAWTKQAELVTLTSQISESTPPIASILVLFVFPWIAGLLSRGAQRLQAVRGGSGLVRLLRRLQLGHGELLVVFTFVAITAAMPGVGLFRQVMPCLMVPQYFGQPSDQLAEMAQTIPSAWAPTDPEVARVFWEGEDVSPPTFGAEGVPVIGPALASVVRFFTGPLLVPWRHWLAPLMVWTGYISAYLLTAFCLVTLFQRSWEQDEHLNFPVSNLPVELIEPERSRFASLAFFRDPVVWVGLGVAVVYNATNMIHVFNPGIPALGISWPLGKLFTESPWDSMRGLSIYWKPELLGLGYLVPSDVLLSIWVFTLVSWLVRPLARTIGQVPPGFPFVKEQAMGAFVVLGACFTMQARGRLREIARDWRAAASGGEADRYGRPWALPGLALGAVVVIGMPIAFGVYWWASLLYFGIMLVVLLVYARNRAEMGFPIVWGYPLYQPRASMIDFIGSGAFVGPGRMQSMTLLTMFSWLQRSVNQAITSTEQEATIAGARLGYRRSAIAAVVPGAIVFGVLVAFLVNLSAFYEYGGLVLSSPDGITGGQMTREVLNQYTAVSGWIDNPVAPNPQKIGWTMGGALLALGLVLGRRTWPRFPFHAGGYALAYCHPSPFMWFPALLLWTIKRIALHLGGAGLYRRLARGFLALTLGHFFCVGVWSLIGLMAGEWVRRYIVWFL